MVPPITPETADVAVLGWDVRRAASSSGREATTGAEIDGRDGTAAGTAIGRGWVREPASPSTRPLSMIAADGDGMDGMAAGARGEALVPGIGGGVDGDPADRKAGGVAAATAGEIVGGWLAAAVPRPLLVEPSASLSGRGRRTGRGALIAVIGRVRS